MRLYHGSTFRVANPKVSFGRRETDFGKGFYTTMAYEQAVRWANLKKRRANNPKAKAVVSIFEFDEALLKSSKYDVLFYDGATQEWLDFVVGNRRGRELHQYDMVMGPVANDNLYATISLYENGGLTAEAAVVQLKTYKLFNQLSFHSPKAVATLAFVQSIVVEEDEQ